MAYIIGSSVAFFFAIVYLANVADSHARRIDTLEKQLKDIISKPYTYR